MSVAEFSRKLSVSDQADLITYGRQVIATEAAALTVLGASLESSFALAISTMLELRGRVIATGIGKSGHIARKFAATLSSTGMPALYVHPAEAAHGDLGMLMPGDGLIAFSNSGSTAELEPVLAHAGTLGLPIIGIASRADSLVMRHAHVELLLPRLEEACPANLAPTTSTSMMMALGDALAMTVMRARGISRARFEALHPGGAIGKKLMRIAAIMHQGDTMPLVSAEASMRDVIVTMTSMSFGIAGVVDEDGLLVGVITDGDLRRNLDRLLDSTARHVMTQGPIWVAPSYSVEDTLALLNQHKITAIFAVEDQTRPQPVGLVHIHDILRLGFA